MDFGCDVGSLILTKLLLWCGMLLVGGGYAYVGAEGIWELSVLSAQFCCAIKTALKNEVYLNSLYTVFCLFL